MGSRVHLPFRKTFCMKLTFNSFSPTNVSKKPAFHKFLLKRVLLLFFNKKKKQEEKSETFNLDKMLQTYNFPISANFSWNIVLWFELSFVFEKFLYLKIIIMSNLVYDKSSSGRTQFWNRQNSPCFQPSKSHLNCLLKKKNSQKPQTKN